MRAVASRAGDALRLLPLVAACSVLCCAPVLETHHESVVGWRRQALPTTRAPDQDTLQAAAVRDGIGVRVRVTRFEACTHTTREWLLVQDRVERKASVPTLILEGALVAVGTGVTVVAGSKAAEDPGSLDSSSNRLAGVVAGAAGVLTAVAATGLTLDLIAARDSTHSIIRKGRPDQTAVRPCRARPETDALVALTLGDETNVEGITDEAGEVLLATPVGLPLEAYSTAVVSVDGRPLGPLPIAPAPCR